MSSWLKMTGANQLRANVKQLEANAQRHMTAAIKSAALLVQNDAKEKSPYKTGNLKSSIHIEMEGSGDETIANVGTNVVYAATQEFGDDSRNIPAQPYLRPALDENRERIKAEIKRVMETRL